MDNEGVIELESTGNERVDDVLWGIAQKIMERGDYKSQRALNADVARSNIFICFYADGTAAKWIAIKGAKLLEKMDPKQVYGLAGMSGIIAVSLEEAQFINRTLGDGDAT